jgi:hypothetical protein
MRGAFPREAETGIRLWEGDRADELAYRGSMHPSKPSTAHWVCHDRAT